MFVFPTQEVDEIYIKRPPYGQDDQTTWDPVYRTLHAIRLALVDRIHTELVYDKRWHVVCEPFGNGGQALNTDVFCVHAYDWDAEDGLAPDQHWNFIWRDVAVRWYKYFARSCFVNRAVSEDELAVMQSECLEAIAKLKFEDFQHLRDARLALQPKETVHATDDT